MAALVLTKQFIRDKESKMKNLVDDLYRDLTFHLMLIESETLDRHIGSLETNVLGPAAELNQTIACSSTEYYLREPRMELLQSALGRDQIGEFVLKDVVKWRNATASETHGGIACLFSGIYRKGMKRKDDLALVKPTVLVLNRETIDKLQEYKDNYNLAQHTRQRSPRRADIVPSGKISPSLPSSRSSPAKPLSDRQRGFRSREGSISDSGFHRLRRAFRPKGSGNDRKTQDSSVSNSRPHHIRRPTEDRESKRAPSRETREKERRSTASTSSRQSSMSHSRPGITLTPGASSEYPTQARTLTAQHESHLHVPEEGSHFLSDVKDFSGSPVPWEESEGSGSDSVANVLSNVEDGGRTIAQKSTGRLSESMHLPRSSMYRGGRHPNAEEFERLQDYYRRRSLGPGYSLE